MPTTVFPGVNAFVTLPRGDYTFDSYTLTITTEKVDVTDYDRVAARFLPGAAFGTVTLSGPLSSTTDYPPPVLGMLPGNEYPVFLGLSDDAIMEMTVQVETCRIVQRVADVARVEVTGVVNSDFLSDSTIAFVFDDEVREDTEI